MAIPFFIIAVILFAAAYQNQLGYLGKNAEEDIKGFLPWAAAMIAIGVVGLVPRMRPVSNALYFLVILVLLVQNKGIFANIQSGDAFKPVSPPSAPVPLGSVAKEPPAAKGTQKTGTLATEQGQAAGGGGGFLSGFGGTLINPLGKILGGSGGGGNVVKFPGLDGGG